MNIIADAMEHVINTCMNDEHQIQHLSNDDILSSLSIPQETWADIGKTAVSVILDVHRQLYFEQISKGENVSSHIRAGGTQSLRNLSPSDCSFILQKISEGFMSSSNTSENSMPVSSAYESEAYESEQSELAHWDNVEELFKILYQKRLQKLEALGSDRTTTDPEFALLGKAVTEKVFTLIIMYYTHLWVSKDINLEEALADFIGVNTDGNEFASVFIHSKRFPLLTSQLNRWFTRNIIKESAKSFSEIVSDTDNASYSSH